MRKKKVILPRLLWDRKPMTQVKDNDKKYNRKAEKLKLRKGDYNE